MDRDSDRHGRGHNQTQKLGNSHIHVYTHVHTCAHAYTLDVYTYMLTHSRFATYTASKSMSITIISNVGRVFAFNMIKGISWAFGQMHCTSMYNREPMAGTSGCSRVWDSPFEIVVLKMYNEGSWHFLQNWLIRQTPGVQLNSELFWKRSEVEQDRIWDWGRGREEFNGEAQATRVVNKQLFIRKSHIYIYIYNYICMRAYVYIYIYIYICIILV